MGIRFSKDNYLLGTNGKVKSFMTRGGVYTEKVHVQKSGHNVEIVIYGSGYAIKLIEPVKTTPNE